jgi:ABC-type nitrate/sulfonate/bicarbonate transport system substrate-binding protein
MLLRITKQFVIAGLLIAWLPAASFAAETVRLAQNLAPISGLVIVAQERHFFEKNGLDVRVSNFSSGRQALETVLGGGADIATTAEAPITAAALAGQKIALLARMEYSDDKTLTRSAAHIATPTDLKGRRIGFSAGTGSEIYTGMLLKRAGLTPAQVQLVNLRPQDMPAALAAGSIDAYDSWEPFISNGKKALGADAKELAAKGVYAETFNLVVEQAYLQAHPATVTAFLRAVLEAEQWLKAHPEDAIMTVAAVTHMQRADLASIWNDYVFELVLDQRTLDTLEHHAQWRLATGNAPAGAKLPDFRRIIFSAPLAQVDPQRVRLPAVSN